MNGKRGRSGEDFEEFTKFNSEGLMRKIKSLALMRRFIFVVSLRFTSRNNCQVSSFDLLDKIPKISSFIFWLMVRFTSAKSESMKD